MKTYVYQRPQSLKRQDKKRRQKRRLNLVVLLLLVIYVVGTTMLIPVQTVAAKNTISQGSNYVENVDLDWPSVGQAALGAEGYGLLASYNTEKVLPTASVIKTVMALSVLEKYPLSAGQSGPTITINQQDVDSYNWYLANHGSVMPVRLGQKLTERQALEAAMLRSANNVADTLAIWAFGSMSAYRDYATQYVKRIGLTDTTIGTDASGLNPSTVSTAADLVKLGLVAMKNPALVEIVGLKSATIPEVGIIENTNNLLGRDGIVGIKTGTDVQNKGVYLFASRYSPTSDESVLIVGAIMGAPTSSASRSEALRLLTSARTGFAPRTLFTAGQVIGSYSTQWNHAVVNAVAAKDVSVFGWRQTPVTTSATLNKVPASAKAGTVVGSISITRDGKKQTIGSVRLAQDMGSPSVWWRMTHPHKLLGL